MLLPIWRKVILNVAGVLFILFADLVAQNDKALKQGLVGLLFDDTKLTRPVSVWYLQGLNSDSIQWQSKNDFSARWLGYLKAPYSGEIRIFAEADNEIKINIDGEEIINTWEGSDQSNGIINVVAGRYYPVLIQYSQISGISSMKIFWQWEQNPRTIIPASVLFFNQSDETIIEEDFKSSIQINIEEPGFDIESIIEINKTEDIDKKRKALISFLWGKKGYPIEKLPQNEKGIVDSDFVSLANLKRIDKLTVEMDFGLKNIAYHFIPAKKNNELILYHQGHRGKFSIGIETIKVFLEEGYDVIAFSMPLLGMNNKPDVHLKRFGKMIIHSHNQMKLLEPPSGHPVKYFLEYIAATVNYAEQFQYRRISMLGISGGGWTTTLFSAIDPRVSNSYPTAGSLPNYLRAIDVVNSGTLGDYEQQVPDLYRLANFPELYIMGSFGTGRRQLQILNEFDSCCFSGTGFESYKEIVQKRVGQLGAGSYDIFLDSSHRLHQISPTALKIILNDLEHN